MKVKYKRLLGVNTTNLKKKENKTAYMNTEIC